MVDEEFVSRCRELKIGDIFYPDSKQHFNLGDIARAIAKGRVINVEEDAPLVKSNRKKPKAREIIKEVVEKPVEVVREMPILRGCYTIAIFNTTRGAGATATALRLAEDLKKAGYTAAIIALDGKRDLACAKTKVPFILPEEHEKDRIVCQTISFGSYSFLILDFGEIFSLTAEGRLKEYCLTDNRWLINELIRTDLRIGMAFSSPWHRDKVKYFLSDDPYCGMRIKDLIFLFDGKAPGADNASVYERNEFTLRELLYLLGITKNQQGKRG